MRGEKVLEAELARAIADNALTGTKAATALVPEGAAEEVADAVTRQNPLRKSKRFYAVLAACGAGVAAWVGWDVQESDISELLNLIGVAGAALFAAWDKFSDVRPKRN